MVLFLLFFLAGLIADFDDAERNALQEVEPADQLKWLLEDVDDDLSFAGWLQTQVAPPPGVPQLRCDCVAALHSRDGKQPPWACLIEAQGQPLAGMAVWTMIYLGLLHDDLRYEGRDRFQMMAVILNLSEGELSHTIDWQVPLKKRVEQLSTEVEPTAPAPAAAEPTTPAAPAAKAPGVSCQFFIKNVRKESATKTLDRIERGELGLCILVWLPLMEGADNKEIVRRWRALAMQQADLVLRANYASLALVFAEMAGRKQLWETELEGFSMQESTIIRTWREEGKKKGMDEGSLTVARAAVLSVLQTRFPGAPVPEGVRSALEKSTDVQKLNAWLREAVLTASPADLEHFLAASAN